MPLRESLELKSSQPGLLTIEVLEGKFTKDTEMFGKMDPFVILEYVEEGVKYKTYTVDEGGTNPVWNESFDVPI